MRFLWQVDLSTERDRALLGKVARCCRRQGLEPIFLWPLHGAQAACLRERRAEIEQATLIGFDWLPPEGPGTAPGSPEVVDLEVALGQLLQRERPAFALLAVEGAVGSGLENGRGAEAGTDRERASRARREFSAALRRAADLVDVPRLEIAADTSLEVWRGAGEGDDPAALEDWLLACQSRLPQVAHQVADASEPTVSLERASFGALQRRLAAVLGRLLAAHAGAANGPLSLALGLESMQVAQDQLRNARRRGEVLQRQLVASAAQADQCREQQQQADLLAETLQAERGWLRNAVRFLEGERDILRGRAEVLIAELAVERAGSKRARGRMEDLWRVLENLQADSTRLVKEARHLAEALGYAPPRALDSDALIGLAPPAPEQDA